MATTVGCSCGTDHKVSDRLAGRFRQRPFILVGNVYGAWWVPTVFIAFHNPGTIASRISILADKYGWASYCYQRA